MSTSNKIKFTENSAGISDVPGFQMSGVYCDVRGTKKEVLDLGIIYSKEACAAAGVFTKNDIKAAPVRTCIKHLQKDVGFHAIVANSGNANAATGEQGAIDSDAMCEATATELNIDKSSVLVCSTGRIGREMPMQAIHTGIEAAAKNLDDDEKSSRNFASAILTSDTRTKTCTASFQWEGETITLAGCAKGAGMIQPDMATMLCFIATDVKTVGDQLKSLLKKAVSVSFNRISVDGDMSTNDTVLVMANGASGITLSDPDLEKLFLEALTKICKYLAYMIVGDGERITKLVTLNIKNAASEKAAENVARAIGNSLLVKTSWYGSDPNWGRLLDAAGYAGAGIIEEKLEISYEDVSAFKNGKGVDENIQLWKDIVAQKEFSINFDLNMGNHNFSLVCSDLTEGYVDFNKSE